jgi:hypothetical protein
MGALPRPDVAFWLLAGLAGLALGCGQPAAPEFAACPDGSCRLATVEQAYIADPQGTMALLADLDPVEQEALVVALGRAHPEALASLCDGLPADSAALGSCRKMQQRPHLAQATPAATPVATPTATREAPGPAGRHPPVPSPAAPSAAACEAQPACVCDDAGQRPGQACEAKPSAAMQRECWFAEAEALARRCRWEQAPWVLWLCARSEGFANGCVHHSVSLMLPDLPPADAAGPADAAEAGRAVVAIEAAVGAEQAPLYRDFFWALWTSRAAHHAVTMDGRLLAVLPSEAWPHVRDAVAFETLRREGLPPGASLADAVALVRSRLEQPGTTREAPRFAPTIWKARDFWPQDLDTAREGQIPAGYFMGPGRRAVVPDPDLDLALAVLEASAQQSPPPPSDFYSVVVMDDQRHLVLRWTALRLLIGIHPQALPRLDLSTAPGALRARAMAPAPAP